eukprot:scaffold9370_cov152-Skeletonema_marinoi.AAC.28
MAKSGLEKRQIGKKRKEADEQHATLFSFYCLPLRYILTPGLGPRLKSQDRICSVMDFLVMAPLHAIRLRSTHPAHTYNERINSASLRAAGCMYSPLIGGNPLYYSFLVVACMLITLLNPAT